jgi:hypothetical protein
LAGADDGDYRELLRQRGQFIGKCTLEHVEIIGSISCFVKLKFVLSICPIIWGIDIL